MSRDLKYKGYVGACKVDLEENLLIGDIVNTKAFITFVAETPAQLFEEMKISIDDYLLCCSERGEKPSMLNETN